MKTLIYIWIEKHIRKTKSYLLEYYHISDSEDIQSIYVDLDFQELDQATMERFHVGYSARREKREYLKDESLLKLAFEKLYDANEYNLYSSEEY